MLFAVVTTHETGVPKSRPEILAQQPLVGRVVIADWQKGHVEGRALRFADIKHPTIEHHPTLLGSPQKTENKAR